MALFNLRFTRDDSPDIEKIKEQLIAMQSPQAMVSAPQQGPVMPGQELGSIEALQQGTVAQPAEMQQRAANLVGTLLESPTTQGVGANLLQNLIKQSQGVAAEPLTPSEKAKLRDQARPVRDAFGNLRTNFSAMSSSFEAPEGKGRSAADLAMVIQFAKMLDPTSVVRSEEGETIQKTGGFFGYLKGFEQQIRGSGSLDSNSRQGLMAEAARQYKSRASALQPDIDFYKDIAVSSGMKPSRLLTADMLGEDSSLKRAEKFIQSLQGPLDSFVSGGGKTIKQGPIPLPAQREKNAIYPTKKGPMKWTGTGWVKP